MNVNPIIKNIEWLNHQLDQINCRTAFLSEMVNEEDDEQILMFLEKKLNKLDKQCSDIGLRIEFEMKQLYLTKGEKNVCW